MEEIINALLDLVREQKRSGAAPEAAMSRSDDKSPKRSACINKQSNALHTLTRRVLALSTIAAPLAVSPYLSK